MSVTHHHHLQPHASMFGLARHAHLYEHVAGLLASPLYRRVAGDVAAAGLPSGAIVLDVGTGPGQIPEAIAKGCPHLSVVGVDLAPEMIDRARQRTVGAARLRFDVADVAALPFADDSVDLVVSTISMHHWDLPEAGLSEIARVLRPAGQAWIYDFRWMVRRAEPICHGLGLDHRLESRLTRSSPLNPIGRIVLRRDTSLIR